jgi:C-terminal processing protease CtpA/Prc
MNESRPTVAGLRNAGFGFVIRGSDPARVEQLEVDGAAARAGLRVGDAILKINGIDVRQASHTHLVKVISMIRRTLNG